FNEYGQWYFQNGPQQVFVDLELAPRIWRVAPQEDGAVLVGHTGDIANTVTRLGVDAEGVVWAQTDLGPGAIDDRQLAALLTQALSPDDHNGAHHSAMAWVRFHGQQEPLPIEPFEQSAALEFGFVRQPRPADPGA
ncbi:MAG: DUF2946 family protein, partial [Betaproteobacteria bacterium]|nr:DUF2946 family protein [Betaproteobacteria bacterium]